jgi:hypothetical protein
LQHIVLLEVNAYTLSNIKYNCSRFHI